MGLYNKEEGGGGSYLLWKYFSRKAKAPPSPLFNKKSEAALI